MKLPAFQFYPGDWRKDPGVQSLDFHDRGVWFEILCLMHESESRGKLTLNGAPMPESALARLLGLDKQILTTTLTTLLTYGVASTCEETGAIMSRRMVRDEYIRQVRAEAGKKGGNPALLKQIPTTQLKQIPTPSSSSSSSVSTSSSKERTPKPPKGDVERQAELIYAEYPRKVAKKPAIKAIVQAAKAHGHEFLIERTKAYAIAVDGADHEFLPHPATWFNQERFKDDPKEWVRSQKSQPSLFPNGSTTQTHAEQRAAAGQEILKSIARPMGRVIKASELPEPKRP